MATTETLSIAEDSNARKREGERLDAVQTATVRRIGRTKPSTVIEVVDSVRKTARNSSIYKIFYSGFRNREIHSNSLKMLTERQDSNLATLGSEGSFK